MKYFTYLTILVINLTLSSLSHAQNGSVVILPKQPTPHDSIQIGAYNKIGQLSCHADIPKKNPDNLAYTINIEQQNITLFIFGEILPQFAPQPAYCHQIPTGSPDITYVLGNLSSGTYSLKTYVISHTEALPIVLSPSQQPFEQLSFTVKAAATAPNTSQVPIFSPLGLITLLVSMTLLAALFQQRKERKQ